MLGKQVKTHNLKQILSKSGFPYEFREGNPTNSFLSYSKQFPYEGKPPIIVSRDIDYVLHVESSVSCKADPYM